MDPNSAANPSPTTDPTPSLQRHDGGGSSWAQPNHTTAIRPNQAMVKAWSLTRSVSTQAPPRELNSAGPKRPTFAWDSKAGSDVFTFARRASRSEEHTSELQS